MFIIHATERNIIDKSESWVLIINFKNDHKYKY